MHLALGAICPDGAANVVGQMLQQNIARTSESTLHDVGQHANDERGPESDISKTLQLLGG